MAIDLGKYSKGTGKAGEGPKKSYITFVQNNEPKTERETMLNAGYEKARALRASGIDIELLVYEELLNKVGVA